MANLRGDQLPTQQGGDVLTQPTTEQPGYNNSSYNPPPPPQQNPGGGSASVRARQQAVNDAGGNIVVDGIWGRKSQAAYDQYIGGGSSSSSSDANLGGGGNVTTAGSTSTAGAINSVVDATAVGAMRDQQLEAAMASIAATFGGNISQQEALLAELDPRFNQLQASNLRKQGLAGEDAFNAAAERGIFQSGITQTMFGEATQPFTEAIAEAKRQQGVEEKQYQASIEQLRAQQEAKEIEAQLASERDALDFELYLAGLGY